MSLEEVFHQAMQDLYYRTGRQTGYLGNYFLRSVRNNGGIATAKRMMRPQRSSELPKGLQALFDAGRLDLSLEALVLDPRYQLLFTTEELEEARERLSRLPQYAFRHPVESEDNHPEVLSDELPHVEGSVRRVLVNAYERDRQARELCLKKHGLRCVACGMSFEERYGAIGRGFIHVHHLKPLASVRQAYTLDPERDLVPVCPNCHAMLHTSNPPLSVAELKSYLEQQVGSNG